MWKVGLPLMGNMAYRAKGIICLQNVSNQSMHFSMCTEISKWWQGCPCNTSHSQCFGTIFETNFERFTMIDGNVSMIPVFQKQLSKVNKGIYKL